MLADAFIADQAVFMCTLEIASFAQQTAGPRGTSSDYVEHVKGELLSSLPLEEARQVIVGAAEITRSVGRNQARSFSPNYPDIPARALRNWCEGEGMKIVHGFMMNHDVNHDRFLNEAADAKRPMM
jgi:hypothetical protein